MTEREAIVAWLREWADAMYATKPSELFLMAGASIVNDIAEAIEGGTHWEGRQHLENKDG